MKHFWILALSLVFVPGASAQGYNVVDLGPLIPAGINIDGEVAGNVNGAAATWTAAGGIRPLGLPLNATFSHAVAINDLGLVAGTADAPGVMDFAELGFQNCSDLTQPFVWSPTTGFHTAEAIPSAWPPLVFYDPCDQQDYAAGINLRGQIVGSNMDIATYKYGYVWTRSNNPDLLTGDYQSSANAINDLGVVAGQIGNNILNVASHAAIWNRGVQLDLGTLVGNDPMGMACSGAAAMNDMDQVVGWSGTTLSSDSPCSDILDYQAPVHAFLWSRRTGMRDLGTLPGDSASVALKVNIFGIAIGMSGSSVVQNPQEEYALAVVGRPFLWSPATGMRDLNDLLRPGSGWTLNAAADINAWGQIVGTGTFRGETHGFLLTPRVLFWFPSSAGMRAP